jgi:inorganic pyrophosphatase
MVEVVMDRPLGSHHPSYPSMSYPVNYGYIPNTQASDGEALDAYYLGVDVPLVQAAGMCIAIIHRLDDDDDKLVVVPVGMMLTDADIRAATHFQEQYFTSEILR